MPIFISYSHENKEFVDALATQLVRHNVNVWLDSWELKIGDSMIDRIQHAIEGSSALLVVLSKASVVSDWCKKELNSGFLKELEEKRVVVMPVLLEDCEIPLFARDKKYADFRSDFDQGLRVVLEGAAKITNPNLARTIGPEWHTDWSLDWGYYNGLFLMTLTYVEQIEDQPYTCLTIDNIVTNEVSNKKYEMISDKASQEEARKYIVGVIRNFVDSNDEIRPLLADENRYEMNFVITGVDPDEEYAVNIIARRLGEDTGRNILVNTSNLLRSTYRHMNEVSVKPKQFS